MKMEEYNGEDFHYIVSYRPLNDDSASDIKVRVNAPQRADAFEDVMSYSVPKQPTFQPYEISVEAANSLGSATGSLDRYKGYSGQDVPSLSRRTLKWISPPLLQRVLRSRGLALTRMTNA
jgi:hypothetical protein